jgi:hypothetical protein
MSDLIQQAQALDSMAADCESTAENWKAAAIQRRAQAAKLRELDHANRCKEAAKLREQAREPLRLWVNVYPDRDTTYAYTKEEFARIRNVNATRIAVPMVEVRPGYALVKVPTDEELIAAWHSPKRDGNEVGFLRANANALGLRDSLAGVEVEK